MRTRPAFAAACTLALSGGVAAHGQAAAPYGPALIEGWRPVAAAPVWPSARRGAVRQLPDFAHSMPSPRPIARPVAFDSVPEELLLKLPDLPEPETRVVEQEVDFSELEELRVTYRGAVAVPVDAERADDLIRATGYANVRGSDDMAALDDSAALAYATCAAAAHAQSKGYEWLRRISAFTRTRGPGRIADEVFTLTRAAPEGQALSVRAVMAACAKAGIPAPNETGDKG